MSRTRKERHLASARPRLRRVKGKWQRSDGVVTTTEHSFQGAYQAWVTKAIAHALKHTAPATVAPPAPYKGEVTVVKGVYARPALKMSRALQIAAERARAVQAPIRSMLGTRGAA